jgi:putative transposase
MERLQAFKYRLKTNPQQEWELSRIVGACRWTYNKGLEICRSEGRKKYPELCKLLVGWRKEVEWLKESPAACQQQALKNLDRAFVNYNAGRAEEPQFRKKGKHDSFRFCQSQVGPDWVFVPKVGRVRFRCSRPWIGKPKNVSVSRKNGKWYVSIQTEREVEIPVHPSTTSVGVDVGVAKFATLSDGTIYQSINPLKHSLAKLARLQRQLAKKVKFSANWKKQKARIAKLQEKIANVRKDYLHKTSTEISKNHAMVAIEDLRVSKMSKSAKGTAEKHGRNVKQKSGLNRSILDQGWFEFRQQLEYKAQWNGGRVVAVRAAYTSQTCSRCKHVERSNRQSQSVFACVKCGHAENADVNAAKNIHAAGHAVLACGDLAKAGSLKQEPPIPMGIPVL